jgi:predicted transcriptional regulator of viral defense system
MDKKLIKGEYLDLLLRSPKTVFSTKDVALLWGEERENAVSVRLNSYTKAGKLIRLRRGLYAKDKNYDKNELAAKIFIPAYISFETVLGAAGVTFQYYSQIFLASYQTKEIEIGKQKYSFKRVKENILTSNLGINSKGGYSIATIERAFLDVIYLNKQYHFDNLRPIDWEKVRTLLPIYGGNKRMEMTIKKLEAKENNSSK